MSSICQAIHYDASQYRGVYCHGFSTCHVIFDIYTTIGELSSKFYEFLAGRSQFDSDHVVDFFMRLHIANPRPLCDIFFRFIVLRFFTIKIHK